MHIMMQRGVYMSIVIYKTIITFLVIYAIIEMSGKLFRILTKREGQENELFIFIHVKNQENSIEYIIRCTILNYLCSYGGRTVPYIVVVDKGSTDRTREISEKLCKDYDFLYYTTEEEYLDFKNQFGD